MGINVRNNTQRLMGYGGARIEPGESKEVNVKAADAKAHPFFKDGLLSIERVRPAAASSEPTAADLKAEIAATEDMDRLAELSEDSRSTVAEAAQARMAQLREAGVAGSGDDGGGGGE